MTEAFSDVYIGWKPATSEERYLIGVIRKEMDSFTFHYIADEVSKASRIGFQKYFEFPQIDQVYHNNIIEIFSHRLTPKSRFKTASVFRFWEITERILNDPFATLAFTQAMLPTDNFEFLADFYPIKGLAFITDLAYTKSLNIPAAIIDNDDPLTWDIIPEEDSIEEKVLIKYDGYELGYIKEVHANIFKKYQGSFRLRVHGIERRETLKRVFVKIELL